MVEHLAKIAAIHPPAARRASIKMLSFVSGRIASSLGGSPTRRPMYFRGNSMIGLCCSAIWFRRYESPTVRGDPWEPSGLGDRHEGSAWGNTSARQRFLAERLARRDRNAAGGGCRHQLEPGALNRRPTG